MVKVLKIPFLGKRRARKDADEDCLNANILTQRRSEGDSSNARPASKLNNRKSIKKPFRFLQKRSDSPSTMENSLVEVAPPEEAPAEKKKDKNDRSSGMLGVCGRAAVESIRPDPETPEPREDARIDSLQKQLQQLQGQVSYLHRELDYASNEKKDAYEKGEVVLRRKVLKRNPPYIEQILYLKYNHSKNIN